MFVFLSKLIPQLIYPVGLASILLVLVLIFRNKNRIRNFILILSLALLWLGGNRWIAYSLARSLEQKYPPLEIQSDLPDMIVVLGGGTESLQPPRQFVEINGAGDRVLYAARLFREGVGSQILLSGGSISWYDPRATTPAAEMADILEFVGVPIQSLILQSRSQNTYEDAVFSSELLKDMGVTRIILVTSALHMPRSVGLFEAQGINVIPAPTDTIVTDADWQELFQGSWQNWVINFFPNIGNMSVLTASLKEYIGMLVYQLRGWY